MKKYFIFFVAFMTCLSANAEKSNYKSLERSFKEKLFSNGKIEFDKTDIAEIERLYVTASDSIEYARLQYLDALARFYALVPDYRKASNLADKALSVLIQKKYPRDFARLALLKGMLCRRYKFEYAQAYHWLDEALKLFEQQKDTLYIAKTYSQLGILWMEVADYESALKCNEKAEKLYAHTDYKQNMSFMRCNSNVIYSQLGEYNKSIELIKKELKLNAGNKDTAYIFILNHNLGQNYYMAENYKKAYEYYQRALSLILICSKPNLDYRALSYFCIGKLYLQTGQVDTALSSLKKGLEYTLAANLKERECEIYHKLFEVYEIRGEYRKACEAVKRYETLSDSLNITSEAQKVQRMKYQAELKNQQQQAQIEKQKNELKQTVLWIILLSLLLAFIIVVFILSFINHRRKIHKLATERLAQQLEKEEMKNALQQIAHDRDIEEKQREIATARLLVAEKNALLEQLSETFKPYKETGQLSQKMWNEIHRFVQNNIRKDEEWEKFKIHFEKVCPDFFVKLKAICPLLTENELHLCSYIRIGVRIKEIAEMLSITPASVATSRYRIKKKLGLSDELLDDYLRNL